MDKVLKFMVEKNKLSDRVELLGYVPHHKVNSVLNRGHIFFNTSITEAFCIAALEAASSGLLVVTTNVGGTPEILPEDLLYLADPNAKSLFKQLEKAMTQVDNFSPSQNHERVSEYYNWKDVSTRVERVYYQVLEEENTTFLGVVKSMKKNCEFFLIINFLLDGVFLLVFFFVIGIFVQFLCEIFRPESSIEKAISFDLEKFNKKGNDFGDMKEKIIEEE